MHFYTGVVAVEDGMGAGSGLVRVGGICVSIKMEIIICRNYDFGLAPSGAFENHMFCKWYIKWAQKVCFQTRNHLNLYVVQIPNTQKDIKHVWKL